MKLIPSSQYILEATEAVRHAQKRVYLQSLVLADHPETHSLIVELDAAARRGIEVVVAADILTYGEVSGGFLPFRYYSHGGRNTNRMVKNLRQAGVKFHWLGKGRITLYHGRTHSKWCIVDETVFAFGGVNLYNEGIQNVDYMWRLTDTKLADRLIDEQKRIQRAEMRSQNYHSVTYEQGDMNVLIDGGIIGQSVIYRRTLELAEQASHIVFVSQYCPTSKLAKILKKKSVDLYFNRPIQADGLNRLVIRIAQFTSSLKTQYKKPRYLHAKFIIFTMKDGKKIAISGSHNFAYTGVLLGTREIAFETADPAIIKQLEAFLRKEII
ncbi:MAG: phospholipase D-like domain-containing protein [Candidatus Microsaccharimonas sp.]